MEPTHVMITTSNNALILLEADIIFFMTVAILTWAITKMNIAYLRNSVLKPIPGKKGKNGYSSDMGDI